MKVKSFPTERQPRPELDGFDAALDFQPDWGSLPSPRQPPRRWKLLNKFGLARPHQFRTNRVFSYPEVVVAMLARPRCPSPASYGNWLHCVLADQETLSQLPETILFTNAWIEWAEGNHLEPDLHSIHEILTEIAASRP